MKRLGLHWHLWNTVLAVAIASAAVLACEPARAQSTCRQYVNSGLGISMEGTPAEACEALRAALSTPAFLGRPVTIVSCGPTETGIYGVFRVYDPLDEFPHDLAATGACSAEPPASGASEPELVPVDWSNDTHLLQLLLICCCVFIFTHGYGAGNRL